MVLHPGLTPKKAYDSTYSTALIVAFALTSGIDPKTTSLAPGMSNPCG
ncbi:MAG: hypothetical protein H6525_10795 [Actinobacteria bacterium]|nr:hypothetical protein [Actinomycetota bacterium]